MKNNLPLKNCSIDERFQPVSDIYKKITGVSESNANAIMHHRIALYGSSCEKCSKPLRTPKAKFCAACGIVKGKGIHISLLREE